LTDRDIEISLARVSLEVGSLELGLVANGGWILACRLSEVFRGHPQPVLFEKAQFIFDYLEKQQQKKKKNAVN
jgi:hypothetical protein